MLIAGECRRFNRMFSVSSVVKNVLTGQLPLNSSPKPVKTQFSQRRQPPAFNI
jgi:hypothetical protein